MTTEREALSGGDIQSMLGRSAFIRFLNLTHRACVGIPARFTSSVKEYEF